MPNRSTLLLAMCAVTTLALPVDARGALPSCRGEKAVELSFSRAVGSRTGRLSWSVPGGRAPDSYQVHEGSRLVGDTADQSIDVKVRPGHTHVFSVRSMDASAQQAGCVARLKQNVPFYAPLRPVGLAVTAVKKGSARLLWSPSSPGDARMGAYRVYRDGRPYTRVHGLSLRVPAGARSDHSYKVAGADTQGHVGDQSTAVRVIRAHHPPERPRGLRATRVTDSKVHLSWSAAKRRTGRIAGYRIFRNGVLVRQVRGLRGSDRKLAPATRYRFAVAAVDTQGYQSSSVAVSRKTATPAPTRGHAHAFLLASTDESFSDLQRHYRQIGTVYPTYFDCRGPSGAITGRDDPLVTRWAQVRRIRVLPRLNCQQPGPLHSILTDQAVRASRVAQIVALVRRHGYDGINLDFENGAATDRDALTAFVSEVAVRLHALGKRLAVEVSARFQDTTTGRSGFYDYAALGRSSDHVFVMNWGWHWETSAPGAPDDFELCRKVADYVAAMPNKQRFVLGTHLYGMDWPNGGGPANRATSLEHAQVRALIARYRARPVLDPAADAWTFTYTDGAGAHHEVWYPNAATAARRIRLARDRGLGIGFWRLGMEDQGTWGDPQIAPGASWRRMR